MAKRANKSQFVVVEFVGFPASGKSTLCEETRKLLQLEHHALELAPKSNAVMLVVSFVFFVLSHPLFVLRVGRVFFLCQGGRFRTLFNKTTNYIITSFRMLYLSRTPGIHLVDHGVFINIFKLGAINLEAGEYLVDLYCKYFGHIGGSYLVIYIDPTVDELERRKKNRTKYFGTKKEKTGNVFVSFDDSQKKRISLIKSRTLEFIQRMGRQISDMEYLVVDTASEHDLQPNARMVARHINSMLCNDKTP